MFGYGVGVFGGVADAFIYVLGIDSRRYLQVSPNSFLILVLGRIPISEHIGQYQRRPRFEASGDAVQKLFLAATVGNEMHNQNHRCRIEKRAVRQIPDVALLQFYPVF